MIFSQLIEKGGAVMWPLLALGLASFLLIVDRVTVFVLLRFSKPEKKLNPLAFVRIIELIGQVAPILGFLGTVTGIMAAFKGMSLSSSVSLQTVSGGMYEALYTTATGLIISLVNFIAVQLCKWGAEKYENQSGEV